MAKHPTPADPTQLEMFSPETLGTAPAKPKARRIRSVKRDRLSDWFRPKDLLPDGEGQMLPSDNDGDDA